MHTKPSLSSGLRPLREALALAALVVGLGLGLSYAVSGGLLWRALEGRLGGKEEFALQRMVFDLRCDQGAYDIIAGDAAFVRSVQEKTGKGRQSLCVVVQATSMDFFLSIAQATRALCIERYYFQSAPAIWTDASLAAPMQRLELWQARQRPASLGEVKRNVRLFFDSVTEWAASPPPGKAGGIKPAGTLLNARFVGEEAVAAFPGGAQLPLAKVFWVHGSSPEWQDTSEDVRRAHAAFLQGATFRPGVGHVVAMDHLGAK